MAQGGMNEQGFSMEDRKLDEGKQAFNKTSLRDFLKLIKMTKPKYLLFVLGILISLAGTGISLIVPKMVTGLANSFAHGVAAGQVASVIGLYILSAGLSALSAIVLGIFGERIVKSLRTRVWDKMIHLRVSYFDERQTGELSSRLANDTMQVKDLIATNLPQAFSQILLVLGSIFFMIQLQWRLLLVMVVAVPVMFLIMMPMMNFGKKIAYSRQDAMGKFQGIANESLSEVRLIKSSNAEKQATASAREAVTSLYKVGVREAIFDGMMQPVMMMTMMLLIFGILAYGVYLIATGVMTLGTLLGMMLYLMNMIGAIGTLAGFATALAKASGSTGRITELLGEAQEELEAGQTVDIENKTLKAENISFSYDDSEEILKNVSFEAEANSIVAFAGPSGGGKSTIFAMLERFYQPTSGQLTIGGQAVNDISLESWRSQIGFVSQDSAIMAGSIRDNLTYGLQDRDYSDAELWQVLELAYARKFVEDMPEQLDTQVGERGVKISGGQRQRIAIARAFLRNPKILMLDEATASLDSESEAMVQKALDSLMKGRTTLVIAHRLSTIVDADKIYFIEKGQVTGAGRHAELVESHPLYGQYVKEQVVN
ncbi:multidrug ABC transporter ATP-binding and permease protein [Lactococcus termiticola]|uniref:Multidrug resistance ABC transporter ATP-binding and permease protein n=2 Tax=Lactococcus termiticola TaxID=2169526 RepID=A0A2R5HJ13_9LACT|nr:multidrug ABC transporter ATP-binding and permease protein [Lactococcus termiticola]